MMKRIPIRYPVQRGRGQKGQAILLIALSMIALIAFVALGIEANSLFELKRRAQNAADAAAVSGAYARCGRLYDAQTIVTDTYYQYDGKSQPSTSPGGGLEGAADTVGWNKARLIATANGFTDGSNGVTVTVQADPDTNVPFYYGSTTEHSHNYMQVIINATKPAGFMGIFYRGDPEIQARATGFCSLYVTPAGLEDAGIVALDGSCGTPPCNTNKSVMTSGSGDLIVKNGHIITNSAATGTSCSVSSGGGGSVIAEGTAFSTGLNVAIKTAASPATDGVCSNGGGSVQTYDGAVPPAPTNNFVTRTWDMTSPTGSIPLPGYIGACQPPSAYTSGGTVTLDDGNCVDGDITLNGSDTLNCNNNAIIYMKSGSISIHGGATVNCPHAFFYFSPGAGSISATGNGVITFGAPDGVSPNTGKNYKGLAYFQNNAHSNSNTASFSGGTLSMTGTFYIPNNEVDLAGGGTDTTVTAQVIADVIKGTGSSKFTILYDPTYFYTPPPSTDVFS